MSLFDLAPADHFVLYRRHPAAGIARRLYAADTMAHDSFSQPVLTNPITG
jgi:hypothetical protein